MVALTIAATVAATIAPCMRVMLFIVETDIGSYSDSSQTIIQRSV